MDETRIEALIRSAHEKRKYAAEAHYTDDKAAWLTEAAACVVEAQERLDAYYAQRDEAQIAYNAARAEYERLRSNGEWKHALITTAEHRLRYAQYDYDRLTLLIERGEVALKKVR